MVLKFGCRRREHELSEERRNRKLLVASFTVTNLLARSRQLGFEKLNQRVITIDTSGHHMLEKETIKRQRSLVT